MDGKQWAMIAGASVPIIIALGTLLGRNTTLINENVIRITSMEENHQTIVQEFLKATDSRKRISDRVSHLEGRLSVTPPLQTDIRGHR